MVSVADLLIDGTGSNRSIGGGGNGAIGGSGNESICNQFDKMSSKTEIHVILINCLEIVFLGNTHLRVIEYPIVVKIQVKVLY